MDGYQKFIVMSASVCLSMNLPVCAFLRPFAHIENHNDRTSPNFLWLLPVAAARLSSGGVAVLPVFVNDVYFYITDPMVHGVSL